MVGSNGGRANHPFWYRNLLADPEVEVQVGVEMFAARAGVPEREEKERLWRLMVEVWPEYDRYRSRTRRDIPVVVLQPR